MKLNFRGYLVFAAAIALAWWSHGKKMAHFGYEQDLAAQVDLVEMRIDDDIIHGILHSRAPVAIDEVIVKLRLYNSDSLRVAYLERSVHHLLPDSLGTFEAAILDDVVQYVMLDGIRVRQKR